MKIVLVGLKTLILLAVVTIVIVAIGTYLNLPIPWKLLVVKTGSMEPTIPVGSLVAVEDQGKSNIDINYVAGDIITFKQGSNLVSHRIVEVQKQGAFRYFQTKGDANKTPDQSLVAEKDTIGKVALSVPYIGRFVDFVKTPLGFFLLIAVPIFLIIISEMIAIWEELRKDRSSSGGNLEFAKPIAMVFVTTVFLTGSHAFFTSVATSTNNVFETADSFANEPFVDDVIALTGTFGHCCSDLSSDPLVAKPLVIGAPDSPPETDFIQISNNSSITLKFVDNRALPTGDSNPDIRIYIYDTLFPSTATVEVSQDGTTWFGLGSFPDTANVDLNIESTGLTEVKYVRLTDIETPGEDFPTLGFDLDAVEALNSATD